MEMGNNTAKIRIGRQVWDSVQAVHAPPRLEVFGGKRQTGNSQDCQQLEQGLLLNELAYTRVNQ